MKNVALFRSDDLCNTSKTPKSGVVQNPISITLRFGTIVFLTRSMAPIGSTGTLCHVHSLDEYEMAIREI